VKNFTAALDDDPEHFRRVGAVFEWVREINRQLAEKSLTAAGAAAALAAWNQVDSVLGVGTAAGLDVPAEITALAEARTAAKKAKDFKRADAIRNELKAKGLGHRGHGQGAEAEKDLKRKLEKNRTFNTEFPISKSESFDVGC